MEKVIYSKKVEDTKKLGEYLGKNAKPNMIFCMKGDLGAGKTTLTQGIAKGLGITKNVSSPTFTIMKVYKGRLNLYHIDAYRLEGIDQDLGFEEMMEDDGLTVIEWPMFLNNLIDESYLEININYIDEDNREITIKSDDDKYKELIGGIEC